MGQQDESTSTTGAVDSTTGTSTTGEPGNEPPVARDDGPYAVEGGHVLEVGAGTGPLDNDEDPEGSSLTVVEWDAQTTEGGTVAMNPDGSFSYTPPAGLPYGTDDFEYTIADEDGATSTARVRVAVQPANGVVELGELGPKGLRIDGVANGDESGHVVSDAGDINGDGYADVIIGAPGAGLGAVYLVFGAPNRSSPLSLDDADVRLDAVDGVYPEQHRWASGVGDVNGDGYHDLIMGTHDSANERGESYLFLGGPALPSEASFADANVVLRGIDVDDWSGWSVSGAGDVNGDGYADIIIGGTQVHEEFTMARGEAYLILGRPTWPSLMELSSADARFEGWVEFSLAGWSVAGAGDFDGDGFDDLLIGATGPGLDSNGGEAYLILGAPTLPSSVDLANADVRFRGGHAGDRCGYSVSGVGDVNGDGRDDILIGCPEADVGADSHAGASYLVFGSTDSSSTVTLSDAAIRLEGVGAHAGGAVGLAGDFNGDGYSDFLVGVGSESGDGAGYLVLGDTDFPPTLSLAAADVGFHGNQDLQWSGYSVGGGGDFDGDGYADLLIGAPVGGTIPGSGTSLLAYGDDLTATTTVLGTDLDDDLAAWRGALKDVLVGGRGNDLLRADTGPDVLRGGQGDDTLVISNDQFFRLDGGLGTDTLELGAGLSLSQAMLSPPRITGIEAIRLAPGAASSVAVSERVIVRLSDTSNVLTIDGDADDEVNVVDGTWSAPVPDGDFVVYESTTTAAVLRVRSAVSLMFL